MTNTTGDRQSTVGAHYKDGVRTTVPIEEHDPNCPGCEAQKTRDAISAKFKPREHDYIPLIVNGDVMDSCVTCGKMKELHADKSAMVVLQTLANSVGISQSYNGLTIAEWADMLHRNAAAHGFHDEVLSFDRKLMLIIGELSEAHEHYRSGKDLNVIWEENGKPDGVAVELIDTIIRCFDTLEAIGFSGDQIEEIMIAKHKYNVSRPFKHGRKF